MKSEFKKDIELFKIEFQAWSSEKKLSKYNKKNLPIQIKKFKRLVRENPSQAAEMLSMYYLTCGKIG